MSWNFTVEKINRTFEQLAAWYRDFMHRTELSFRALHQRVLYLEDRQAWQGPSDEQVERVLRKILAEKFADAGVQRVENPNVMKDGDFFVERPKEDLSIPKAIPIDISTFLAKENSVPSKAYQQTLNMLQNELSDFPSVDLSQSITKDDAQGDKDGFKRPKQPSNNQHQLKHWA